MVPSGALVNTLLFESAARIIHLDIEAGVKYLALQCIVQPVNITNNTTRYNHGTHMIPTIIHYGNDNTIITK